MDRKTTKKLLTEERDRLLGIQEALAAENLDMTESETFGELAAVDQHPADVGTETFEREKDMSILSGVDAELTDVERALDRLEAGTYGRCEACGRPIGESRLAARPAARFCIDDQARVERESRSA